MIIWKSTNNAEGKNFPLGHPSSEAQTGVRIQHYANSRMALGLCLQELEPGLGEYDADDLEIANHHHLTKRPEILCSLAHTRDLAVACLAQKSTHLLGVGIDCENLKREFNPAIISKFDHNDDCYDSPLELWCAKEAAFKAADFFWQQSRQKTFVLKDIVIRGHEFFVDNLVKGELSYEQDKNNLDFLICIAKVTEVF